MEENKITVTENYEVELKSAIGTVYVNNKHLYEGYIKINNDEEFNYHSVPISIKLVPTANQETLKEIYVGLVPAYIRTIYELCGTKGVFHLDRKTEVDFSPIDYQISLRDEDGEDVPGLLRVELSLIDMQGDEAESIVFKVMDNGREQCSFSITSSQIETIFKLIEAVYNPYNYGMHSGIFA